LGFVAAVVMSAKATPKAMELLESIETDELNGYEYTRLERARLFAPVYIPTAGMVLLSTGMLMASDRIIRNRYASLLAIYSITERAMREWQSATTENVTKKKLQTIKEQVLSPDIEIPAEEDFVDGNRLFWDAFSGRFFYAQSVDTVRRVFSDINLSLVHDNFVPLNSFYEDLGMDPVGYGYDSGWNVEDGDITPIFDSIMRNDRAYIRVQYDVKARTW
jgi:uncharacterized protein with NRDE domain